MADSTLPKRRPNDGTVMPGSTLPKRRPNGTVMPGSALNPSGRPRIVQEIQELARSAAPAAFDRVVALMNSDDERIALAASQEILNRAYGKPVMQVQSDVRRLDMSAVWASTMETLNKQKAEPPMIDVTAAEPALEYVQTEPPPDDDPAEW
jgi:hypothetical protein